MARQHGLLPSNQPSIFELVGLIPQEDVSNMNITMLGPSPDEGYISKQLYLVIANIWFTPLSLVFGIV
jgi:hypothetical protein